MASLSAVKGVRSVRITPESNVYLAKVQLDSGGELWLFLPSSEVLVDRFGILVVSAGGLKPRFVRGAACGVAADFSPAGLFADQLDRPITSFAEAVSRYAEIVRTLESWPRCPDFESPADLVKYCVVEPGSDDARCP